MRQSTRTTGLIARLNAHETKQPRNLRGSSHSGDSTTQYQPLSDADLAVQMAAEEYAVFTEDRVWAQRLQRGEANKADVAHIRSAR